MPNRGYKQRPEHIQKRISSQLGRPRPAVSSEKHARWKGDKVGYDALHGWIRRHKPKPDLCEICKLIPPHDLANVSGKYKRDVNDFRWLCHRCHMYADGTVYSTIGRRYKHTIETKEKMKLARIIYWKKRKLCFKV